MNKYEKRILELEAKIKELEKIIETLSSDNGSESGETVSDNPVVASFDFSKKACRKNSGWKIFNGEEKESTSSLRFNSVPVERIIGSYNNPVLIKSNINIPATAIKQVHVRLKAVDDALNQGTLKVRLGTEKHIDLSETKAFVGSYPVGILTDVYVDIKNKCTNGIVTSLRIDFGEGMTGNFEIDFVELVDSSGNVLYKSDFSQDKAFYDSGWQIKNVFNARCNGSLCFDVGRIEKKKVYTDPYIVCENVDFDAKRVKYIRLKMRTDIENAVSTELYMQVFFKTRNSNFWTQDKSMKFSYEQGKSIDAYVEVKQLFWKGQVIALRVDPFETYDGTTEIELIELLSELPDKKDINLLEARTHHLEDRFSKIYN